MTEAACAVRDHGSRSETVARHLAYSPGEHSITLRSGEKWNGHRKANYFSRFSDAGVPDDS